MEMNTPWIWTTLALFAALFLINGVAKRSRTSRGKKLPPSPKGVPILGHLHLLGKSPHRELNELAKRFGPIMYLRLGFVDTVVVSSPQAAELFLKTNDLVFASRPPIEAAKYIGYDLKSISFSPYGAYWRSMRKLCTLQLLSNQKIDSFRDMRWEEMSGFVESMKQAALDRQAVNLSTAVAGLSADMSCRMVLGKKYEIKDIDERGFKGVIKEAMQLAAKPNLGDYFPYLGKLDLQGNTKRMKAIAKVFDEFFERILDNHEQGGDSRGQTKNFVDTMLSFMESGESEFQISREHTKAILLDMLAASMDTSANAIDWLMSELLRHPNIMKKLQQELESKVGLDRLVEESDLEGLNYLEMVMKESLRLHPVGPLLSPREARKDCEIEGYHIPRKARILVNVWAIGHDSNVWDEPEKFMPERFEGRDVDYRGHDFELIPFGSGRRSCPGLQLGITVIRLVVAQLVHCFDWELPNGMLPKELDMDEDFGLAVSRANHLMAIPKYRLSL